MFNEKIIPRFSDTDALGHINNTMVPVWFEGARNPIFKIFMPKLDVHKWPLILAKIDVEFHLQLYYQYEIEVKTYIKSVGNSSFVVYQELWQQQKCCVSGNAVMVNFCYETQKSKVISNDIRTLLTHHLFKQL